MSLTTDFMGTQLTGQIERITYANEENGYTIAKVKVKGHRDLVTVVGTIMAPAPGEILDMTGVWSHHPKFGEQFKVEQYQTKIPATVFGIKKYLGSGLIKGIGPVMAGRIVKQFGKQTLDILEENIDRLSEVNGIGKKRIAMIKTAWADQKEIRNVMLFLASHGVSSGYAAKIFKEYGNQAITIVRENPYRLAMDIFGIGFVTADRIAEKMGFDKNSPQRAQAGIVYVLSQLSDEGHVYYPYEPFLEKCGEILEVERNVIAASLADLSLSGTVVLEDLNESMDAFEENHKAVYLAPFHVSESGIAERLVELVNAPSNFRIPDADKAVKWVEPKLNISLAQSKLKR